MDLFAPLSSSIASQRGSPFNSPREPNAVFASHTLKVGSRWLKIDSLNLNFHGLSRWRQDRFHRVKVDLDKRRQKWRKMREEGVWVMQILDKLKLN